MILFLLLQIEWQTINRPYSDVEQELVIYFSIPREKLKHVVKDSLFYVEYESQLKVYDEQNNQLIGDFWEVKRLSDTLDIHDSVKILIPKNSSYFHLKIVDLHASQVFNITEKILKINYIGNIKWDIINDTLRLTFIIINPEGTIDSMLFSMNGIKQAIPTKTGTYDDSLSLMVGGLLNDNYALKVVVFSKSEKIDEMTIPIIISRPFYLDEFTWLLKVNQLEYIAASSEIKDLKRTKRVYRDSLWRAFWKQHDPTPNTEYNEKEVEYFERIEYCEDRFSHGDRGWRSDRARIYVRHGDPDEIISQPYYSPPVDPFKPYAHLYDSYEVWHYYRFNRMFVFGDRYGLGEYILLNPTGSDL
jgi:GWxTD domain-containing protein